VQNTPVALAFTAVSGITGDHNRLAKHLADPAQFATKENITTIDGVKSVIKPDIAAKNVPEEISEFQKAFNAVLKDAGSKQLLVLAQCHSDFNYIAGCPPRT
jgi:hypothetical protein